MKSANYLEGHLTSKASLKLWPCQNKPGSSASGLTLAQMKKEVNKKIVKDITLQLTRVPRKLFLMIFFSLLRMSVNVKSSLVTTW